MDTDGGEGLAVACAQPKIGGDDFVEEGATLARVEALEQGKEDGLGGQEDGEIVFGET